MPQNICTDCSRQLQSAYDFIKKAQEANDELIKMIPKPLDCLQEQTIDIPAEEIDNLLDIKQENANFLTDMTQQINRNSEMDCIKMEMENLLQIELREDSAEVEKKKTPAQVYENDDNSAGAGDVGVVEESADIDQTNENIKSPNNSNSFAEQTEANKNQTAKQQTNENKTSKRKCQQCDYTANTYAALDYHLRAKHGSDDDKFKCTFCDYYTCKKCNLLAHIRKMHRAKIKEIRKEREAPTENR